MIVGVLEERPGLEPWIGLAPVAGGVHRAQQPQEPCLNLMSKRALGGVFRHELARELCKLAVIPGGIRQRARARRAGQVSI